MEFLIIQNEKNKQTKYLDQNSTLFAQFVVHSCLMTMMMVINISGFFYKTLKTWFLELKKTKSNQIS